MNITNENYSSPKIQKIYMGVSQYKAFQKCPSCAMAELNGDYQSKLSTSMLVGSYIDAYFEGSLEKFKEQHSTIFKTDGNLKCEFIKAEQIIERVNRDDMFMKYMSGG